MAKMACDRQAVEPANSKWFNLLEQYRNYNESDKEWKARKQFIFKHIHSYPGPQVDRLLALSMVFTNHVFMGCRYNLSLMEKVLEMADGIDIGERPSFELVPGAKPQKRSCSPSSDQKPSKKQNTSKFQPRPRFEPMHFVASSTAKKEDNSAVKKRSVFDNFVPQKETTNSFISTKQEEEDVDDDDYTDCDMDNYTEYHTELAGSSYVPYQNSDLFVYDCTFPGQDDFQTFDDQKSNFMNKLKEDYTAKFEAHQTAQLKGQKMNPVKQVVGGGKQGCTGLGFKDNKLVNATTAQKVTSTNKNDASSCQISTAASASSSFSQAEIGKKKNFIEKLSAAIAQKVAAVVAGLDNKPNYTMLLASSIQACHTNPEYIYVSLKEIPPADLPKKRQLPADGYACELRCNGMYLSTGYSGSKIGARDRAMEQAVKLLQKSVGVKVVCRKSKLTYIDDLVVYQIGAPLRDFPPALKQVDKINNMKSNKASVYVQKDLQSEDQTGKKPWDNFILNENASDPIGVMNNSAAFNKMTIEYKHELLPTLKWRCQLYLQGHLLAEGFGSKKYSKQAAAVEAIRILRKVQASKQLDNDDESPFIQTVGSAWKKQEKKIDLRDILIYENATNAVCTLNDTAQFNKIAVEYRFSIVSNQKWKCDVYLADQFVASAVGIKKNVKHSAAEIAVNTLKQTQPVVKANLTKGLSKQAISRNQIIGRSTEESYKQQIKEDNIGNQLLRKMGWRGGGLGKEGEGIAEPIAVKEQFTREGLGLITDKAGKITRRDIEGIIRNYASSNSQEDLTFAKELTIEERKQIHQMAQKYGLKSKSYGQGIDRFLIVRRKQNKEELISQLMQEGQAGCYQLVMPQTLW
ncbi:NF-kappa-B-repressing factor [Protopterus annectens]|uniref:NF-kappa-B-repressing factor n=1 Tax=Protopterus annectens TaxID=7888 RepID=UPI001CF98598|nr:NF-kappa-B-repressing factor [Protopterus annectens]